MPLFGGRNWTIVSAALLFIPTTLLAYFVTQPDTSFGLMLAVASTDGYSFAEIEELKNLLVMNFMEKNEWDWSWALKQFDINRHELNNRPRSHVGFGNHVVQREGYDLPF